MTIEIFLFFFSIFSYSRAQTFSSIPTPTTEDLYGIDFVTDNIGYACGNNGTILKTVDGGKKWKLLNSHTGESLLDIKIIPGTLGQKVVVAGSNKTILKSYDGGTTWQSQSVPLQSSASVILGLQCLDSSNFYACGNDGNYGVILKTVNGGNLWTKVIISSTFNLNKEMFVNSSVGYSVGTTLDYTSGSINKSVDAGASWSWVKTTSDVINNLWCINPSKVITVGLRGKIWQTIDAGATWTDRSVDTNDINGVCFIDALTGFTCGKEILKTTDGGITWSPINFSLDGKTLSSISIPSPSTIYMAGIGGKVIKASAPTICQSDSVVLILQRKYKEGGASWEQSSDKTTWSTAQGTSYNDSLAITATNTYYYRAKVSTCDDVYSDTVMITVPPAPDPPAVSSASDITPTSFTAHWTLTADATAYYVDVATNAGFTSFVSGYNNLNVGYVPSYEVSSLSCNTTYYYRVRSSNSCARVSNNSPLITLTTSANPSYCTYLSTCNGNVTDARNNETYKTVQLGTQCWMARNLNIGNMIMGSEPQTPGADNQNTSIQKYCNGDDSNNCKTYGGLYLWTEMMAYGASDSISPGRRGICPEGWHLPTDSEWKCLEMNLGMTEAQVEGNRAGTIQGGSLKDTTLWTSSSTGGATNSSGFAALPGGSRGRTPTLMFTFSGIGGSAGFWSATENDPANAWFRSLYYYNLQVGRSAVETTPAQNRASNNKVNVGLSVRCVQD